MRVFVPVGTKFSHSGITWVAGPEKPKNAGTGIAERIQIWKSKKSWMTLTCRYDIRREKVTWEVSRFNTSQTRNGAAAMAATLMREILNSYAERLAAFGDENEKKYGKLILKKRAMPLEEKANEEA